MILEAHRGVSNEYPENTLPAFRAAKKLGYGMIELDTKFTADGRCVILHDRTIHRTARRPDGSELSEKLPIAALTLEEARRFDYGIFKGAHFAGTAIPTLTDVLDFAATAKIPLKFDNVMMSHTAAEQAAMLDEIERSPARALVGFTSGSVDWIAALLQRMPDARIHYDGAPTDEALAALAAMLPPERLTVWLRQDNACTAWCKTPPATPSLAAKVKRIAALGLWLLREPHELDAARVLCADIVETDGSLRP